MKKILILLIIALFAASISTNAMQLPKTKLIQLKASLTELKIKLEILRERLKTLNLKLKQTEPGAKPEPPNSLNPLDLKQHPNHYHKPQMRLRR
jgi:Na+-translocating ferredoxin:NAD+ oxidoreductase RnfG subunit